MSKKTGLMCQSQGMDEFDEAAAREGAAVETLGFGKRPKLPEKEEGERPAILRFRQSGPGAKGKARVRQVA